MLTIAAQTFLGSRGGIARVSELTARAAADCGYPISLLSVQDEGGLFQEADVWRGAAGSRLKFLTQCWSAAWRGDRLFYDQLGSARAHIWPARLAKPCGTWIHGIEVWDQLRPDRVRAAHCMGYMLANTKFTRERAAQHNKVFESARVCWLGTMEDEPPPQAASLDGPPIVLIIGRLDAVEKAYKGHKELIEIWPSIVDAVPGARLVAIGTGPSLEWHRALAAKSPAAKSIDIIGFESDSDIIERWKRAVVFALPSRGEGFGIAYIEAMRWGIPVIASTHDSGHEVNSHHETGFNVDLDRRDDLKDSIIALLRDRDLAHRMGAAGQRRWREHFRYSAFRERFAKEVTYFTSL